MMAIPHAQPGDVIDVRPLGTRIKDNQTSTLIKTDTLEVIRLVLDRGKEIAEHRAPGRITVQCLEGNVAFTALDKTVSLEAGSLLYLDARQPHSLRAEESSSLLLTILLPRSRDALEH
jgi:quercetin dioxygenase-like cupin family protein